MDSVADGGTETGIYFVVDGIGSEDDSGDEAAAAAAAAAPRIAPTSMDEEEEEEEDDRPAATRPRQKRATMRSRSRAGISVTILLRSRG